MKGVAVFIVFFPCFCTALKLSILVSDSHPASRSEFLHRYPLTEARVLAGGVLVHSRKEKRALRKMWSNADGDPCRPLVNRRTIMLTKKPV